MEYRYKRIVVGRNSDRKSAVLSTTSDNVQSVREHVRAFEYFDGLCATCLYDNMKVVVTGYDGDQPIYNTRFLSFATHYGYRTWTCRPHRPVARPRWFT